jgi:hypothetical protein
MGYIHTGVSGSIGHDFSESVIADLTDHGNISAKSGTLNSLVSTLAAGGGGELQTDDGFAGIGGPAGGGDQIHHEAANNKDPGFL